MTIGYRALLDTSLPALWDLDEIQRVRLQDGTSFAEIVSDVGQALNILNSDILSDPLYSGLFAVQDTPYVKYPVGSTNGFTELTEYGRPDPQRGATTGHMLPFNRRGRAIGWTMMGLMESARDDLDADVRSAIYDARHDFQRRLLQQFFRVEGVQVGATANASVPFADGGATDANYVPLPGPDGQVFTAAHNHFVCDAALDDASLEANIENLAEHGHAAPFDIVASQADAATWAGLTNWVAPAFAGITYMATTDRAAISDVSRFNGFYESRYGVARVKFLDRIPTGYYGIYKSYGQLDARNPLRLRISNVYGFGYRLLPGQWANMPEYLAVIANFYGVGTGQDRTNGVCVFVDAGGSYVTPTIS